MFNEVRALLPIQGFAITWNCGKKKKELPLTSELLEEEPFAHISLAYSQDSFFVWVDVYEPPGEAGKDSVELFIDTRDSDRPALSRFCHHFFFTLEEARELTRFRGDEVHPLADPADFKWESEVTKKGYRISVELTSNLLHGYDPSSFDRLGFTYRINRSSGPSQHFSVSSHEFSIEQNPSTWATIVLR
jgi:hypothetical protein